MCQQALRNGTVQKRIPFEVKIEALTAVVITSIVTTYNTEGPEGKSAATKSMSCILLHFTCNGSNKERMDKKDFLKWI